MISLDDELAQEYLGEYRGHLAAIETDLLAIRKGGGDIDEHLLVNRIFRAVHAVRGAGFLGLLTIRDLAQRMEHVVAMARARKAIPSADQIRVLLRATGKLHGMIRYPRMSNQADIAELLAALARVCADAPPSTDTGYSEVDEPDADCRSLRVLLVEDDFASRLLLQTFLSRYGECHLALNGREAVEAFSVALDQKRKYDLICMDIMMPEMDGREAVRQVRALEESHGILSRSGVKIIMTTAVDDIKEVIRCFEEFCDAYLMKPINLANLLRQLKSYRLVQ
jgi:two-component system chemotaxis response regulator CheY